MQSNCHAYPVIAVSSIEPNLPYKPLIRAIYAYNLKKNEERKDEIQPLLPIKKCLITLFLANPNFMKCFGFARIGGSRFAPRDISPFRI